MSNLKGLERIKDFHSLNWVNWLMCITHRSEGMRIRGAQPPAKTLTDIADALGVSPDFLLYGSAEQKANVKLSDPELIKQFKAIEAMEEEDRNVVKKLIDAFITKKQIQKLAH